jgi:putative ABC transport system permease protein
MARRDVRRHRGRSILILVMIGLPVVLISAGATLVYSSSLDQSEQEPYLFGTGQAIVTGPVVDRQITQEPLGRGFGHSDDSAPVLPVPGFQSDPTRAIATLLGGDAIPLQAGSVKAEVDGRKVPVQALGVALQPEADLGERAHLLSGRWPQVDSEVVVTSWGVQHGLPTSGTISIDRTGHSDGTLAPHTVVGVADAVTGGGYGPGVRVTSLVLRPWQTTATDAGANVEMSRLWLITGRGPVSWEEVRRLNEYGLVTVSRSLWELAPQDLPSDSGYGYDDSTGSTTALAMAAAAAGLLFTTALLAGPAFAVSASRQRRTLALSAANGATQAQVRRTILAQAVVLGGAATAAGTASGVGLVAALRQRLALLVDERLSLGLDVPWGFLAAVAGSAMVSAVVAAVLPARALGRLDIVRAMRGQEVARPVRHRVTVIGLVLLSVGAVLTLTQFNVSDGFQEAGFGLIGGSAALTVGALCVVPSLLTVAGRLGRHLPLSLRMAARDSARQRARTGPTVAAVMAGAALLSATVVAIASDTAEQAHTYVPTVATGTGTTYDSTLDPARVAQLVASVDPTIITMPAGTLASAVGESDMPWATGPGRLVQAQRRDCTLAESRPSQSSYPEQRCWSIGTDGMMGGGAVRTMPADDLSTLLGLDPEQRKAVADGAIVLPDRTSIPTPARAGTFDAVRPVPADVQDGAVHFWVADGETDENGNFATSGPPTTVAVPALVLPWDQFTLGQTTLMGGYSAYLADETAERLGWARRPAFSQLVDPTGPISRSTEASLTAALGAASENAQVKVERGFERDDTAMILVLMGIIGLIILVATFVSTALSLAEQLPLMGTLAAVGATRMTRRKLAGAQAFLLSGLGALVGAAIGLLPGIAAARTITTTPGGQYGGMGGFMDTSVPEAVVGPFIVIPWLQVTTPVLVIPLIAAAFAFLSIRRSPTVTRRTT